VWSIASALLLLATAGWSQQPSITWLGTLPSFMRSVALGVSADGSVVVGEARNAVDQYRAFRWTQATGMQDLGTLGGGWSEANGVSADGSVVVGGARNAAGQWRAFRWTQMTGMQDLGTLPSFNRSTALSVSADGSVVVGFAENAAGQRRAFRWTQATGMQDLGTLGGRESVAWGVSADGSVVVGWTFNAAGQPCAFRWTPEGGMEDLNQTYARLLTGGSVLSVATAISPNGRYIVGGGFNTALWREEAFLLDTVPEPASLLALGAGLAGLLGLRRPKQ